MSLVLPMVKVGNSYSRRLHPISCRISKTLQPLSTVSMTLPPMDEIDVLDWVRIETPDGDVGYYRVESVNVDASTGEKDVNLNHGACTLDDTIIVEQAGRKSLAYHKTVREILSLLLGKQSVWTVGTVEAGDTVYLEPGDTSIMTAILTMMDSIPDYQIEFRQNSETNWTVNIISRPTTPICECRLSRNLKSCNISYSTDDICTRVYAEGLAGGKMDSSNIGIYGIKENLLSLNENLTSAQKSSIARAYLNNHDHPKVSVSISGIELSQITGLNYDNFVLGTVCRVVIPWLGIEQEEVVVDKTYSDLYNYPEDVDFTLANATPDLSLSVAAVTGGGSSINGSGLSSQGLGGVAGERKRFETKFEQTDEYFRLVATEQEWDTLDHATITSYGQFVLTHDSFQLVVDTIGDGKDVYDFDGETPQITPVTITGSINAEGSKAYINADHVYVGGTKSITLESKLVGVTTELFQVNSEVVVIGNSWEDGMGNGKLGVADISCSNLDADTGITAKSISIQTGGQFDCGDVSMDDDGLWIADDGMLHINGQQVNWQSQTVVTSVSITMPSVSVSYSNFGLVNTSSLDVIGYVYGGIVTGTSGGSSTVNTATINYLGKANS